MESRFILELRNLCKAGNIPVTDRQLEQMETYYGVLCKENEKYNLTALKTPEEAALKHFYDSIVPCGIIPQGANLVDVGSGGGFPAVPLKIMRPDLDVTAMEASQKKCLFIEAAARTADVKIMTVNARAEEEAHGDRRETFKVLTARAVSALPMLIEITAALVEPGGMLLYYKADYAQELQASQDAMKEMQLTFEKALPLISPSLAHFVLVMRKGKTVPASLPRRFAQIKKKPL